MEIEDVPVIFLAGGKGSRLYPLTKDIPKPMVQINGVPILEHNLRMFQSAGFRNFIFSLGYLPEKVIEHFQRGERWGVNIKYSIEDTPKGTAGAVKMLENQINSTFIVSYADVLRDLDIQKMLSVHWESGSIGTINVYRNTKTNPKSLVRFSEKNEVIEFIERPQQDQIPETVWSNGSFYILEPEVFSHINPDQPQDFGYDVFPNLVKDKRVIAFPTQSYLLDIGTMEKVSQAERDLVR